jgi:hypothetical protein
VAGAALHSALAAGWARRVVAQATSWGLLAMMQPGSRLLSRPAARLPSCPAAQLPSRPAAQLLGCSAARLLGCPAHARKLPLGPRTHPPRPAPPRPRPPPSLPPQAISFLPEEDEEAKAALARWIGAFARALQVHVQPEADISALLLGKLPIHELVAVVQAPNRPLKVGHRVCRGGAPVVRVAAAAPPGAGGVAGVPERAAAAGGC